MATIPFPAFRCFMASAYRSISDYDWMFQEKNPRIQLYHFRIHYRAARFTDFYVGPIIRCLLTWLKLTILPHRFHPFTCFPVIITSFLPFMSEKLGTYRKFG